MFGSKVKAPASICCTRRLASFMETCTKRLRVRVSRAADAQERFCSAHRVVVGARKESLAGPILNVHRVIRAAQGSKKVAGRIEWRQQASAIDSIIKDTCCLHFFMMCGLNVLPLKLRVAV